MGGFLKSSVAKKVCYGLIRAFSGPFLTSAFFHQFLSVLSPELFNETSHFMGTNVLVQFLLQPVLILGIIFHFVMGIYLEVKNNKARPVKYKKIQRRQ